MKIFKLLIIFLFNFAYGIETEKYSVFSNGNKIEIEAVKGEVIVEIDENKKDVTIEKMNSYGYKDIKKIYKNFYLAKTKSDLNTVINSLSLNNIKAYPNRILKPLYSFPSDPYVSKQWYLNKINAFQSWDFEEYKGTLTFIVMDSGVDCKHSDISSVLYSTQVVVSEVFTSETETTVSISTEYIPYFSYSKAPEVVGHGTMVSGVIAAVRNNNEGISGVINGAKIYSYDVFRGNILTEYGLTKAFEHILNNLTDDYYGRVIINMSLGGSGPCDPLLQGIIDDVYNYNSGNKFIVVAAAGNDNGSPVSTPANCRNVVPVSATDELDKLTYFSNYGDAMINGVSAPGANIYTTVPDNSYESVNGTSFSSPITAAVMGLVWAKRPEFKNSEVIDIVKKTAIDIGGDGPDKKYGWGRVDAFRALSYIESNLEYKGVSSKFIAWPNPFSLSKNGFIKFSVKDSVIYPDDKLMIFDFSGSFVSNAKKDGVNGFMWDGKNDSGVYVAPGAYVAYYKSEKGSLKTKFLVLR